MPYAHLMQFELHRLELAHKHRHLETRLNHVQTAKDARRSRPTASRPNLVGKLRRVLVFRLA